MAMSAELAQVQAPSARWKFALGCARAALVAPQLPSGDGRSRVATVTFLLGVAGCIATTFVVLRTWPHAAGDISRGLAVWFAGSLIVYLWIALRPPRALIAHRDAVRRGVALGFALFFVTAVGKSVIDRVVPPSNSDGILGIFLMVTVVGSLVTTGFAVARTERSFGAGVAATAWIGLVCSILAFNADLLEMLSRCKSRFAHASFDGGLLRSANAGRVHAQTHRRSPRLDNGRAAHAAIARGDLRLHRRGRWA